MAIPASGPISMSMFNTELGRASNASNSSLAGGSTPAVGSLFWLANQSGSLNQTAPHQMSEWYNYAVINYSVTIYSKAGDIPIEEYNLYYSPDNINWTFVAGPISSTTCTNHTTVSIGKYSSTIYIKAERDSDNAQVYIRGSNSSTCPANLAVDCTYSTAITGTESVAVTVYVDTGTSTFATCSIIPN